MSAGLGYRGWDVHSYTADYRQALMDEPALLSALRRPVVLSSWNHACGQMLAQFPAQNHAINKMCQRYVPAIGGYIDRDLLDINVARLLVETWGLACRQHESVLFGECLQDIGGTCVQGDSHRLLSVYLGLR